MKIQLPKTRIDEQRLKSILHDHDLVGVIEPCQQFLREVDFLLQLQEFPNEEKKTIREHERKIKDLLSRSNGRIDNLAAITITPKRGKPITFKYNLLTESGFKEMFGGPKPDMTDKGDFRKQLKYLKSRELFSPFKPFISNFPYNDQLFIKVVQAAIVPAKEIYKVKKRKSEVQRVIIELLNNFFPAFTKDIQSDKEDWTFKTYLNPHLR